MGYSYEGVIYRGFIGCVLCSVFYNIPCVFIILLKEQSVHSAKCKVVDRRASFVLAEFLASYVQSWELKVPVQYKFGTVSLQRQATSDLQRYTTNNQYTGSNQYMVVVSGTLKYLEYICTSYSTLCISQIALGEHYKIIAVVTQVLLLVTQFRLSEYCDVN